MINLFFQDESRFGLFTRNGKALTAKGIKHICPFHQVFKTTYLFGAFSPINGDKFLLELPLCNSETFQAFLNAFALQNPHEFKIMVLDNGAFHKAAALQIPQNIALLFLPAYSPELNPAEKIWWLLKQEFICKTSITSMSLVNISIASSQKNLILKSLKPFAPSNICYVNFRLFYIC